MEESWRQYTLLPEKPTAVPCITHQLLILPHSQQRKKSSMEKDVATGASSSTSENWFDEKTESPNEDL